MREMLLPVTDIPGPALSPLGADTASSVRSPPPVAWQHLCQWKRESVSSYQWGISLLSGLTAVALLTELSQRSLLPTPGVRCQQCAQCWPGMEAVAGLTPVITWQPPSQHQWRWPGTTRMRHTTWTCFLRLSIYYILKSKNRTWTETR